MDMKTSEKKIELLQKSLVEQGWETQDSMDDVSMRILDLRREIQLALIQIKEKMTIYLVIVLLAMVILVRALVFSLKQPWSCMQAGIARPVFRSLSTIGVRKGHPEKCRSFPCSHPGYRWPF